jgi:hypothetical protein
VGVLKRLSASIFLASAVFLLGSCAATEGEVSTNDGKDAIAIKAVNKTNEEKKVEPVIVNNRHVGYYYPSSLTAENYKARSEKLAQANRVTRLAFVTGITKQQQGRSYPPRFAIFAKGENAEKLIIVGLDDETFSSLFRARAALAQMTAMARLTPLFKQMGVQDYFTFFDLTKLLGFRDITVSDGLIWSHRIDIR